VECPLKKTVQLTVNGATVSAEVEPRLQLAELLREHLLLTGTHLGCEHGVCGACTVNVDGVPARSCITFAVACDGADVRTIEGFDEDAVMRDLREAFSAEHALQCGYCTPGMLVTARDIVLRLPDADEARIRKELAGNLCRCTGYVGIVRAIRNVLAKRGAQSPLGPERSTSDFTALRSGPTEVESPAALESEPGRPEPPSTDLGTGFDSGARAYAQDRLRRGESKGERRKQSGNVPTLHQSFTVNQPREKVWEFFSRFDHVTQCLPGATVTGTPADDRVDVTLRVKLGPIAPEFQGSAEVTRDRATWSGVIRGSARDARSPSTTRGEIRYVLVEESDGVATRVDVDVAYTLTGPLAQFGRSGLVQDIARRMTTAFAQNLEARLDDKGRASGALHERAAELNAGSLVLSALWARIKGVLRSVLGR
jgi:carbon-monoxide dehydrogenase small subunit